MSLMLMSIFSEVGTLKSSEIIDSSGKSESLLVSKKVRKRETPHGKSFSRVHLDHRFRELVIRHNSAKSSCQALPISWLNDSIIGKRIWDIFGYRL